MKWPRFTVKERRSHRDLPIFLLGPLEDKVLDTVTRLQRSSVKDVVDALDDEFAYTTIMTTLDRLYKKGYLNRELVGRAYVYSLRVTQEEIQIGVLGEVIAGLLDNATKSVEPVLASIVDSVGDKDRRLLDELERLVKERKASEREK